MPVVEPYAISEPFSTAGKVNLNYVIAPFGYASGGGGNNQDANNPRSYVRRDTALRGVLKSAKVMAVPTRQPEGAHTENPLSVTTQFRFDVDMNRTLEQFEDRLKDPSRGLFRSASEICEMDLFPRGLKVSTWDRFWNTDYAQTGDNMRERPYAHIYPRLTTRSNVYTIHMRCQVVKKAAGTRPDEFVEGRDQVTGEALGIQSGLTRGRSFHLRRLPRTAAWRYLQRTHACAVQGLLRNPRCLEDCDAGRDPESVQKTRPPVPSRRCKG